MDEDSNAIQKESKWPASLGDPMAWYLFAHTGLFLSIFAWQWMVIAYLAFIAISYYVMSKGDKA